MPLEHHSILPLVRTLPVFRTSLPSALVSIPIHKKHLSKPVLLPCLKVTDITVSSTVEVRPLALPGPLAHLTLVLVAVCEL